MDRISTPLKYVYIIIHYGNVGGAPVKKQRLTTQWVVVMRAVFGKKIQKPYKPSRLSATHFKMIIFVRSTSRSTVARNYKYNFFFKITFGHTPIIKRMCPLVIWERNRPSRKIEKTAIAFRETTGVETVRRKHCSFCFFTYYRYSFPLSLKRTDTVKLQRIAYDPTNSRVFYFFGNVYFQ